MRYIFVSYSHKDKEYVHKLAEDLQSHGFEIWIDDRIDYGTQWPLVIETAIDNCDSFILVASENSHVSEWVQHEVARAKRLNKQFFPLLLNGNPWLSFESTQFFDVRDGNLPTQKFYASLRNYESQRFELFRELLVDTWPSYHNAKYQFSLNYPLEGIILDNEENYVRIDLPVLVGTNLKEKSLTIHCKEDGILSSPLSM